MTPLIAAAAALGLLLIYGGLTGASRPRSWAGQRRLTELVAGAGTKSLSAARLLWLCAGAGVVTFFVVAGLTGSLMVSLIPAVGAAWLPVAMLRGRSVRRRRQFREAWPDAISGLIAAVRAGISLAESCAALVERGPQELRPGFAAFASSYRSTGSFETGIDAMRAELSDPITDRVAASLLLAHEVGGTDLVRVLRTLGDFVREDIRVRKEVEARWSWTVTAARVAAAAPWIVLVLMAIRPEAARAYETPAGGIVIAGGAVASAVGYRLMLRAARLPEDRRLA